MNRASPVGMMLQYAFGPGAASAVSSSRAAMHADGAMECEMAPQMLALAAAAQAWWEGGRPAGWSLQQHLAEPTAGCDGSEAQCALAAAVAQWIKHGA